VCGADIPPTGENIHPALHYYYAEKG
jgi:hypothetical protein